MDWRAQLNNDPLSWLLEPDRTNPSIRYFALCELLDRTADSPDVHAARSAIMASGPVPAILDAQHPDGYWQQPGGGYGKYRGTIWQIMLLSELGADLMDRRVQRGCAYVLTHSIARNAGFSASTTPVPSAVYHCMNGNLLTALIRLGYLDDPRVQGALHWQVDAILGAPAMRYYQSGTSGPAFACSVNDHQPCGWGATKALKALTAVPPAQRSPAMHQAITHGTQFLLRHNLASADYPYTAKISSTWFKLGFPLSYWSDVLETLSVVVSLGYHTHPQVVEAYRWVLGKQDAHGRWNIETTLNGRMWTNIEQRGTASKWVTLRALRVMKAMATHSSL